MFHYPKILSSEHIRFPVSSDNRLLCTVVHPNTSGGNYTGCSNIGSTSEKVTIPHKKVSWKWGVKFLCETFCFRGNLSSIVEVELRVKINQEFCHLKLRFQTNGLWTCFVKNWCTRYIFNFHFLENEASCEKIVIFNPYFRLTFTRSVF